MPHNVILIAIRNMGPELRFVSGTIKPGNSLRRPTGVTAGDHRSGRCADVAASESVPERIDEVERYFNRLEPGGCWGSAYTGHLVVPVEVARNAPLHGVNPETAL